MDRTPDQSTGEGPSGRRKLSFAPLERLQDLLVQFAEEDGIDESERKERTVRFGSELRVPRIINVNEPTSDTSDDMEEEAERVEEVVRQRERMDEELGRSDGTDNSDMVSEQQSTSQRHRTNSGNNQIEEQLSDITTTLNRINSSLERNRLFHENEIRKIKSEAIKSEATQQHQAKSLEIVMRKMGTLAEAISQIHQHLTSDSSQHNDTKGKLGATANREVPTTPTPNSR
ncbi:hypothetical protein HDU97_007054, partial [Phlyctochytrium planicorne]